MKLKHIILAFTLTAITFSVNAQTKKSKTSLQLKLNKM